MKLTKLTKLTKLHMNMNNKTFKSIINNKI